MLTSRWVKHCVILHFWRLAMNKEKVVFVGLDASKATSAVSVAEDGRDPRDEDHGHSGDDRGHEGVRGFVCPEIGA
jgi:hypothetical protein